MITAPAADLRPYLDAVAAALARHGIGCRITRPAGTTPVLTTAPPAGPGGATVAIDPDPHAGPEPRLDCTCVWTPPPGTAPEATAAAIAAVLHAAAPPPHRPQPPTVGAARLTAAALASRLGAAVHPRAWARHRRRPRLRPVRRDS
jgi:hypothetical protein